MWKLSQRSQHYCYSFDSFFIQQLLFYFLLLRYFTTFLCTKQNTKMSKTFSSCVSIFHLSHFFNSRFLDWGIKSSPNNVKHFCQMLHKPKTTTQKKKLAENFDGHVRSANSGCFEWMMVQWRRQKRIVNETLQRARRGRDAMCQRQRLSTLKEKYPNYRFQILWVFIKAFMCYFYYYHSFYLKS